MTWLFKYRIYYSLKSSYPIVLNLDSDFHRYHVAILLYGFHGLAISIILSGLESSSNRYVLFIAFLNPKSVTGNMSFLARQNIKNISAVHLPIPFTLVSRLIIYSSCISGRSNRFNLLSTTWVARSLRYVIFILDSPTWVLSSRSELEMICSGVGIWFS